MKTVRLSFFPLLKKYFCFYSNGSTAFFGKRVEMHKKVIFQKNPKKSEKIQKSQKRGEISLRRLKTPT
jgi:hypothetical protein